jgi:hypothetical protein
MIGWSMKSFGFTLGQAKTRQSCIHQLSFKRQSEIDFTRRESLDISEANARLLARRPIK